jgi:predicted TIM-barrel fold metal-dependent hydrolase
MTTRRSLLAMSAMALAPRGACDTHTHVFGDATRFPMSPARGYTPPAASPAELLAMHKSLGVSRVVIVTPSVYGTDNAATLYGMKEYGRGARGIAVIDAYTPAGDLKTMAAAGVRGVRINVGSPGSSADGAKERLIQALDRVSGMGWHVQVYAGLPVIESLEEVISRAPAPLVIDHVGGALPAAGTAQKGFASLLRLVQSGKAYVKVTHRFLPGGTGPDYKDSAEMLSALLAANPQRVLWGTDWPHTDSSRVPGRKTTDVAPFEKVDDAAWFQRFLNMIPNAKAREMVMTENPGRLYGY